MAGRWNLAHGQTLRVANQLAFTNLINRDTAAQSVRLISDTANASAPEATRLDQAVTRADRLPRNRLQVLWTKRYERSGRLTSLYVSQYTAFGSNIETYHNRIGGPLIFANRNRVDLRITEQVSSMELVHSEPLGKRWLAEGRIQTGRDVFGFGKPAPHSHQAPEHSRGPCLASAKPYSGCRTGLGKRRPTRYGKPPGLR